MRPTQHISNNRVIGAAPGWNQAELPVGALAVTDVAHGGIPAMLSFWKPSEEELQLLNAGALVCLSVVGRTMPPVSIIAWKE